MSDCSYEGSGSHGTYCGYHSAFVSSSTTKLYANEPYPPLNGCSGFEAPNGDAEADAEISIVSHEANETITDYSNAWRDNGGTGYEDGDECAYTYGNALGGSYGGGTAYNQVINAHHYYTQDEFSNANYFLGQGDTNYPSGPLPSPNNKVSGCVQRPNSIAASLVVTAPATATAGNPVSVTVKAVDGSSSTVTGYTGTIALHQHRRSRHPADRLHLHGR